MSSDDTDRYIPYTLDVLFEEPAAIVGRRAAAQQSRRRARLLVERRHDRDHPAPLPAVAGIGEGARRARHQRIAWRSVEIPRLPPKPELMPLTGGYRRTPVLQARRRGLLRQPMHPARARAALPRAELLPGQCRGHGLGRQPLDDGALFDTTVKLVLGAAADQLPEAFAKDRGRLYLGPDADFARRPGRPAAYPRSAAHPARLDRRSPRHRRRFVLGDQPGLPTRWRITWSVHPRSLGRRPQPVEPVPGVGGVGAARRRDRPRQPVRDDGGRGTRHRPRRDDRNARRRRRRRPAVPGAGMAVSVVPDVDGGDPLVTGTVHRVDRETISILRNGRPRRRGLRPLPTGRFPGHARLSCPRPRKAFGGRG